MTKLVVGPGEEDNVEFGKMMEGFRIDARYMRRSLAAEDLGLSSEYIRLIERGKRVPAAGIMPRMLELYGVEFEPIHTRLILVNDIHVEFTSRILEARGTAPARSEQVAQWQKRKAQKIGRLVELLMLVDDEMLDAVHVLLANPTN